MSETETEVTPVPETTPEPEPTPEPTPDEPTPDTEGSWAGPSQEEWRQMQARGEQLDQLLGYIQTPTYDEAQPQAAELPEYDPFDPESSQAYFDARDQRLLDSIGQMLGPVIDRESNEQASQWAEQTFQRLGVPEEDIWQEGVLFTSAGFQQYDHQGRPLVHPQQAAAQGYDYLQRFAEHIRADERTKLQQGNAQTDEALRNRTEAPDFPAGPAGGEGFPEGLDELGAARMWRERQAAI